MTSLKRSIIARVIFGLFGLMVVVVFSAYYAARYEADEFMDDYLKQFAEVADPTLPADPAGGPFREPEDRFERIVWKNGVERWTTADAPRGMPQPEEDGFRNLAASGEDWRAFVVHKAGHVIMLLQRINAREELAQHAAIEVSGAMLATVLVTLLIVIWTVGATMRHLNALGTVIAARSIHAKEAVPMDGVPVEVRSIVQAMNVLISRVQTALDQQKRFIADSAHELRTPLTALRIQIDNLTRMPSDQCLQANEEMQAGIDRASSMVNQLLRLARFEGPCAIPQDGPVDLADVLRGCVADAFGIAEHCGVDLGFVSIQPVWTKIAHSDAVILVSNILDNAIRYTPRGGTVDIDLVRFDGIAIMRIVDSGTGVDPSDLPRLTERFFRGTANDKTGSGLGLSIVHALTNVYGLELTIENREDRSGLIVQIRFPGTMLLAFPEPKLVISVTEQRLQ